MFVAYSSVMDRREVLQRGIQVLAGTVLGACLDLEQTGTVQEVDPRLTARPGNPTTTAETGLAWIGDVGEGACISCRRTRVNRARCRSSSSSTAPGAGSNRS
jgi:hypothetical protein